MTIYSRKFFQYFPQKYLHNSLKIYGYDTANDCSVIIKKFFFFQKSIIFIVSFYGIYLYLFFGKFFKSLYSLRFGARISSENQKFKSHFFTYLLLLFFRKFYKSGYFLVHVFFENPNFLSHFRDNLRNTLSGFEISKLLSIFYGLPLKYNFVDVKIRCISNKM